MKMQNVEMEFVAFDAQDVIATSGGPKTAKFIASSTLWDGSEWSVGASAGGRYFASDNGLTWMIQDAGGITQNLIGINPMITGRNTYVLTQDETQYMLDGEPGIVGKSGGICILNAKEGTVADETLDFLEAIAGWLTQYGVPIQ